MTPTIIARERACHILVFYFSMKPKAVATQCSGHNKKGPSAQCTLLQDKREGMTEWKLKKPLF